MEMCIDYKRVTVTASPAGSEVKVIIVADSSETKKSTTIHLSRTEAIVFATALKEEAGKLSK